VNTLSRRRFLAGSAGALTAAAHLRLSELRAGPLGLPIGCQTWPVRRTIGTDFEGTLRRLAADGFTSIELCSPPGYEETGFGPLLSLKPSEMREKMRAAGVKCESCHYGFRELTEHLGDRLAYAKELGLQQMIISSFGLRKDAGMPDWMKAAGEANRIGEKTRKAGLQLGFHNHDGEFQKLDGRLIYDKLLDELEPDLVRMQFQVGVVRVGYQAADYFRKYPGRFVSMHLQDWSSEQNREVPLGQGIVDWNDLFAAAKTGGVRNYYVEMNPDAMKASVPFLRKLG
jgi:sugar phosphate isomerase/epimerase